MDYPDPDEEYELMHADEFELMNEMTDDNSANSKLKTSDIPSPSRIVSSLNDAVNSKTKSTLSGGNQISDLISPSTSNADLNLMPPLKIGNKRTISNLFGDISDIEQEVFSENKKKKIGEIDGEKEARQEILIKTIVEQRKRRYEEKTLLWNDRTHKGKQFHDNICIGSAPKWPFISVSIRGELLYVRLHSDEKVKRDFQTVECRPKDSNFLDVPFKELYRQAIDKTSRKFTKDSSTTSKECSNEMHLSKSRKNLWVEKYKPKIYLQLLSDEATNRALLYWLKLWDKIVFNKEPTVMNVGCPRENKRELFDEYYRPSRKLALLCGPPGLGKTTLAHMISKQAGYCPVEVNASDDRSAQIFKVQLEAATQMKSVMGGNNRPNCLILDEIDGAPQAAIDVLIKYVNDKNNNKLKQKRESGILKRPIIAICNDIYVPALRPLRQIAHTIVFPPTSTPRLGERLMEIAKLENIITDLGTMMMLSEKSNNDIRSCLTILQYLKSRSRKITLQQIQSSNVGAKDTQHGLFAVWESIFQIKMKKKGQGVALSNNSHHNFSFSSPLYDISRKVQSYGDYDRLTIGIFENYAKIRTTESSLGPVVNALEWFVFQDLLSTHIQSSQNYSVYGYLPLAFVQWYLLFASIQRPKLSYPSIHYDASVRIYRNKQILDFAFAGISPKLRSYQQRSMLLLDVGPLLIELITPNLRPVSFQLYTSEEKSELQRVVGIMADYNLNYSQIKTSEGSYVCQLDPNIEELVCFGERRRGNITTYAVKQMLSKEVESEKIKRTAAKASNTNGDSQLNKPSSITREQIVDSTPVRNHLKNLTPNPVKQKITDMQGKDFFGRTVDVLKFKFKDIVKTDEIVKSDIWFHFKEGYNNAVRKKIYISDFL